MENIVEKGEIACYELATVFSKDLYCTHLKPGIVWKRVNPLPKDNILAWFKLKTFADEIKYYLTYKIWLLQGRSHYGKWRKYW